MMLPWHQLPWQQLWRAKQENRLPHALLLVGLDGMGKRQFADALAHAMLCADPTDSGMHCGKCAACHLMATHAHPDCVVIEPETGTTISVDQIRALVKSVHETTLKGGYRVVIIHPAAAMNTNAANALLKTLEEPTPNTLMILISDQSLRLPATILSRCQKITFTTPAKEEALAFLQSHCQDEKVDPELLLKLANGAPLKALSWLKEERLGLRQAVYDALRQDKMDPLKLAMKWQSSDHLSVVDLLLSWLTDLLRYKLTQDATHLTNSDYQADILKVSVKLLHNNLLAYIGELQETRAHLLTSSNLNKQLLLEDIFIRWTHYVPS